MAAFTNAPNVKVQGGSPFDEVMILAGADAWDKTRWQFIRETTKAEANYQPVILGEKQLADINRLRIVPQGKKSVSVYRAGALSVLQEEAIIVNLAHHSEVETLAFYDEALQLAFNASERLSQIRQGGSMAEVIATAQAAKTADRLKETDRVSDKAKAFRKWFNRELARHAESNEIYQYGGKIWQPINEMDLAYQVVQFFEEQELGYSDKTVGSLMRTLKVQLTPMETTQGDYIAFNNGVLNRKTFTLEPHSPAHWLTAYNPVDYCEHNHATPHFDRWLAFVSNGNPAKARNILAALYAIFTNRYNWQIFLEITGDGGSGKSVFAHIATMLVGKDNTGSINLSRLDEERGRAAIYKSKLIVCPDQSKYAGDGSGLKAISGGDVLGIDPKHKTEFNFIIKAVILLINNRPATFTERAGGIERRRVIFNFDRVVPAEQRDYELLDKIQTELSGIARKLLNEFPDPLAAKLALEEQMRSSEALAVKMETDNITAFCQYLTTSEKADGLFIGNGGMPHNLFHKYLYTGYLAFITANGYQNALTLNNFSEAVKQGLRQHGNKTEFIKVRNKNGFRTNVHYKNVEDFYNDCIKRI